MVLIFLADHADLKTQKCWHGIQKIANECHLSKRAVYRAIKELSDMGLIKIESGGGKHQTNTYFITLNGDCVAPLSEQTVTNRHSNGASMTRNGDCVAPQQSVIRKESKGERNGAPRKFVSELNAQIKMATERIDRLKELDNPLLHQEEIQELCRKRREWREQMLSQ